MKMVSGCCLKPISVNIEVEFPDGEPHLGIKGEVERCEGCGKVVEDWSLVFECCGLEVCECDVASGVL